MIDCITSHLLSLLQTLAFTTTCIKCKCAGLLLSLYSCFCMSCSFISLFWVLGSKASVFAVLGSIPIASYIHNPVFLFVTFYIWNSFHYCYRTIQGSLFSSNLILQPINLLSISHLTSNLYFSLPSFFRSLTVFQISMVALTVLMNVLEQYL